MTTQGPIRIYRASECVSFRSTKERFGGLSNMAGGFPLRVNTILVPSSEALYQACRFPHMPEVQRRIIKQRSPMTAKMVSKPFRDDSRSDWMQIRVRVMRWVLRVKLTMHWKTFGELLLATDGLPIVEDSRRDDFWGALRAEQCTLVGTNVLGRLLMELREELKGPNKESLRAVAPPPISNFLLLGEPIGPIGFNPKTADKLIDPDTCVRTDVLWDAGVVSSAEQSRNARPTTLPSKAQSESNGVNLQYPQRLIEVDLPIARISAHSRREKSIRHGHISTLHIWWARRPLAACRAVICAALWPDPADPLCAQSFRDAAAKLIAAFAHKVVGDGRIEGKSLIDSASPESVARWEAIAKSGISLDPTDADHLVVLRFALLDFIADFANWDNSTAPAYLETARALTQAAHESLGGEPGTRPLVVDPFAGGGSIPLESLRVGAEAFASDLNPVAVLLNKVVLEYVPKYGPRLTDEVRKWGEWIQRQAGEELAEFYPKDPDGATPLTYLWARTIQCEGPDCGADVPLLRSLWLEKRGKRSTSLQIVPNHKSKTIGFTIQANSKASDVGKGTSSGGAATCPVCGYTTPVESVRSQMIKKRGGAHDARLIAVVTTRPGTKGQVFREPTSFDEKVVEAAKLQLQKRIQNAQGELALVPDGPINHLRGFFNVVLYGITVWGDLFSPRQALTLTTLSRLVRDLPIETQSEDDASGLYEAVKTCLALIVDRVAVRCTANCIWDATTGCIMQVFNQGQSLPARWEFAEMSPCIDSGSGWATSVEYATKVLDHVTTVSHEGHVEQASATSHPLPTDSAQAIITDPPYYAAIPYADLSDFFYSLLKRSLLGHHRELLRPSLTEKKDELVSLSHRAAMYREKDNQWFEDHMSLACREARRVCDPNGLSVFVFANKETSAWEAMLAGLINAGWVVTASWPLDTESGNRLRAKESAALASSIHLVCRPRENVDGSVREQIGEWRDVLDELPRRIHQWMPRLASEGVVGADAIFACLGPALEIFSHYSRVEKASGEVVPLREYLEQVWAAVSTEALSLIFQDADAGGLEPDARLTAMWLWTIGGGAPSSNGNVLPPESAEVQDVDEASGDEVESTKSKSTTAGYTLEFDAARKIAQGLGVHLERSDSIVEVKGDKARLLSVGERTRHLFGKSDGTTMPAHGKKKAAKQRSLFDELDALEAQTEGAKGRSDLKPAAGETVLDRVHQSMILFAAGRGEALRRFLVDDGAGTDARFWKLAQSLSALYPTGADEKRWVDGVLARKKGLGL